MRRVSIKKSKLVGWRSMEIHAPSSNEVGKRLIIIEDISSHPFTNLAYDISYSYVDDAESKSGVDTTK